MKPLGVAPPNPAGLRIVVPALLLSAYLTGHRALFALPSRWLRRGDWKFN
jgi:hypothetical protein